jgi:hypothetical protein
VGTFVSLISVGVRLEAGVAAAELQAASHTPQSMTINRTPFLGMVISSFAGGQAGSRTAGPFTSRLYLRAIAAVLSAAGAAPVIPGKGFKVESGLLIQGSSKPMKPSGLVPDPDMKSIGSWCEK